MENLIVFFVLIAIVGGASFYIYKKKKAGVRCIGCPCSKSCSGSGSGSGSGACSCSGACSKKFH